MNITSRDAWNALPARPPFHFELKSASARARARLYRRKGVKLKTFPRMASPGAPPLDVAVLNKIAGEYREGKRVAAKRATKRSVKRSKKK